jgi:hypothetical protein
VDISLTRLRNRVGRVQDHRHDVCCIGCSSAADRRLAAMLAPYLSAQFYRQSDFGHPAGAVVGDMIVSDFRCFGLSPKSGLWRGSQHLHCGAAAVGLRRRWHRE